jgi:hypothetical protein
MQLLLSFGRGGAGGFETRDWILDCELTRRASPRARSILQKNVRVVMVVPAASEARSLASRAYARRRFERITGRHAKSASS